MRTVATSGRLPLLSIIMGILYKLVLYYKISFTLASLHNNYQLSVTPTVGILLGE